MNADFQIPEPILFNPLKHHLAFIRKFIDQKIENPGADRKDLVTNLKHLGTSVMDVYTGSLSVTNICNEIQNFLKEKKILSKDSFAKWAGINMNEFRLAELSDNSQWTLKFNDNNLRYVHIFPARYSQQTFRVKANTLKSAMIYNIMIGNDFVTREALNKGRAHIGLSPVKDPVNTEAITEMIEILRNPLNIS
jgi:hypothetical protein